MTPSFSRSKKTKGPPFTVQILHDGSLEYFRNVTLGARHYAFDTKRFVLADRWLDHETASWHELVARDAIQGIIVAAHREEMVKQFTALKVPVVNVSNVVPQLRLPLVTQDDVGVGRLAAEHLLACGCRAFGFWGEWASRFSEQRLTGFRDVLGKHGLGQALHVNGQSAMEPATESFARMVEWLPLLPRPIGFFCVMDTMALYLQRAVTSLGWRVPDDVAVLGAGDDEFWVKFENVPLSSVKLPSLKIGYEAAAFLDELIVRGRRRREAGWSEDGGQGRVPVRVLPVSEIAARQSTDTLFVSDEAVARAVRHIRANAARELYVDEIVRAAGVARTALQRRFKEVLGHSLMDELTRARIVLAQGLLAGSDLPMETVAERSGLPSSHRLSVVFRAETGMSPTEYRRKFRVVM